MEKDRWLKPSVFLFYSQKNTYHRLTRGITPDGGQKSRCRRSRIRRASARLHPVTLSARLLLRHPVFQSFSSGKREADKANEAAPGWRPATRTMLSAPAFTSKKRKSFVNRWYQSVWAFIYSPRFISAENALCAI